MVKIGDTIKVNNIKGQVISISRLQDGRYLISIKHKGNFPYYFIEGDEKFDIINKESKKKVSKQSC